MLDAKRRRKDPGSSGTSSATPQEPTPRDTSPSPGPPPPPTQARSRDKSPMTEEEHTTAYMPPLEGVVDPFAALEAQATSKKKSKGKQKAGSATMSADAFLASLEADIMKGLK